MGGRPRELHPQPGSRRRFLLSGAQMFDLTAWIPKCTILPPHALRLEQKGAIIQNGSRKTAKLKLFQNIGSKVFTIGARFPPPSNSSCHDRVLSNVPGAAEMKGMLEGMLDGKAASPMLLQVQIQNTNIFLTPSRLQKYTRQTKRPTPSMQLLLHLLHKAYSLGEVTAFWPHLMINTPRWVR